VPKFKEGQTVLLKNGFVAVIDYISPKGIATVIQVENKVRHKIPVKDLPKHIEESTMDERQALREFVLNNIEPLEELNLKKIAAGATIAASLVTLVAAIRKKILTGKLERVLSQDAKGRQYLKQIKKDTKETEDFAERIFYLYDRKSDKLDYDERTKIDNELKKREDQAKKEDAKAMKVRDLAVKRYEQLTGEKYKGWKNMSL